VAVETLLAQTARDVTDAKEKNTPPCTSWVE